MSFIWEYVISRKKVSYMRYNKIVLMAPKPENIRSGKFTAKESIPEKLFLLKIKFQLETWNKQNTISSERVGSELGARARGWSAAIRR